MSVLDGVRTAIVVHAHPDDETIASGGLLVDLVDRGVRVVLVTATRGERGEIVPGTLDPRLDEHGLAAAREAELRGALDALGVAEHVWLGSAPARAAGRPERVYRDSGMEWVRPGLAGPSADAGPDAFADGVLDEEIADLDALVDTVQPDVLIGYGPDGGYGHPDHVRAHAIAAAAARGADVPFLELALERGPDVEWFDLERHRDAVEHALRHHRSQLTVDGRDLVHSGGQRQAVEPSVGLRLSPR
ncbi:N-acetyl-1-D-myo-inositol-2-amino-2-deoxy-alpha-D-glucopyranoside deacetylase [Labedella gwakjiensis]|nr:PIG-L family deacetylase [Labedella gwakjiensis]PSL38015.1 N-acetyl-1-D-myo-inositol-2-amino-2-deoxy-alpha-D-glucopyranoside deacetylase [Labedella gwakjiensis]